MSVWTRILEKVVGAAIDWICDECGATKQHKRKPPMHCGQKMIDVRKSMRPEASAYTRKPYPPYTPDN